MPFAKGHKLAPGGRRPGSGRKKLGIRQLCAIEFEKRIPILCEIADSEKQSARDRIAALKELARVGVGDKVDLTSGGEKLGIEVIYRNRVNAYDPN